MTNNKNQKLDQIESMLNNRKTRLDYLQNKLEELILKMEINNSKLDGYQKQSKRTANIAFGLLAIANLAVILPLTLSWLKPEDSWAESCLYQQC